MSEYIERENLNELIDWYEHEYSEVEDYFRRFADEVNDLPAIDIQEEKRGRWKHERGILAENGKVTLVFPQCSECGYIATWSCNFCPNCGADMRAGREEDE